MQAPAENRIRAGELHTQAEEAVDEDLALAKYAQALELDPNRPESLYNAGLIYKYRGAWQQSFDFNRRALELRPDDEAASWNLAIAATALREWRIARELWHGLGIDMALGKDPIEGDFGLTPVRLNPDRGGEVILARRIDPVRARLENIPQPQSGYRWQDLVLHDGAPVGHRRDEYGLERDVFNVLALFESSKYSTHELVLIAPSPDDISALETLCEAPAIRCEDWTAGAPVESVTTPWRRERRLGIAAQSAQIVQQILAEWSGGERRIVSSHLAVEGAC